MVILYILLGLLALLLFIFFVAIRVTLEYNESFSVKIGILFFNIDLTKPRKPKKKKEKKKKEKKPKKEKKKKKKKEEEVSEGAKPKKKKKISDIFGFISLIMRIAAVSTKRMLTLIPIKLYYFEAVCASPEAEKTAMSYGQLSSAAYGLFEALKRFMRFTYDPERVYIYPDFTREKPVYRVKIMIKLRLVYLIRTGFAALGVILKEFAKPPKNAPSPPRRPNAVGTGNKKGSAPSTSKAKASNVGSAPKNTSVKNGDGTDKKRESTDKEDNSDKEN